MQPLRASRGDRLCQRAARHSAAETPFGGHFGQASDLVGGRVCLPVPFGGVGSDLPISSLSVRVNFLELPEARSGHDFLRLYNAHQPAYRQRVAGPHLRETATAETAVRNFVASVFRDVWGCPTVPRRARRALHGRVLGRPVTRPWIAATAAAPSKSLRTAGP